MTDPDLPRADIFIAASVDGFIAREDGGIDWLPPIDPVGEAYGYGAFFDSVDALVMGRTTFELVLSFGVWHYGDKPVYVLTNRPLELPADFTRNVTTMRGDVREVARELGSRGVKRFYADGGKVVQQCLAAGLADRLIVTRIPVLLGRGIPLFGEVPHDIVLEHRETRTFVNGLTQTEYAVSNAGA